MSARDAGEAEPAAEPSADAADCQPPEPDGGWLGVIAILAVGAAVAAAGLALYAVSVQQTPPQDMPEWFTELPEALVVALLDDTGLGWKVVDGDGRTDIPLTALVWSFYALIGLIALMIALVVFAAVGTAFILAAGALLPPPRDNGGRGSAKRGGLYRPNFGARPRGGKFRPK